SCDEKTNDGPGPMADERDKYVSSIELDEEINNDKVDLQSLDDLIHYLEQHEQQFCTGRGTGSTGLESQDSLESALDDSSLGSPTLMLSYRDVARSPSDSSSHHHSLDGNSNSGSFLNSPSDYSLES